MPIYYHASPQILSDGGIILAGRYGQCCRTFKMLAREYAFEHACEDIRLTYFPDRPSRLNCTFACEDAAALDDFNKRTGGGRIHHYEVEAVEPAAPIHRGIWDLRYGEHLHGMVNCSWAYWTQQHQASVEILIGCDVRVLRKIK